MNFRNNRPRRWARDQTPIVTKREQALVELLASVLQHYGECTSPLLGHPCDACATDVEIFTRKARDLGVRL